MPPFCSASLSSVSKTTISLHLWPQNLSQQTWFWFQVPAFPSSSPLTHHIWPCRSKSEINISVFIMKLKECNAIMWIQNQYPKCIYSTYLNCVSHTIFCGLWVPNFSTHRSTTSLPIGRFRYFDFFKESITILLAVVLMVVSINWRSWNSSLLSQLYLL